MRTTTLLVFLFLSCILFAIPSNAQTYLGEIERAREVQFENDALRVENLDLGEAKLGQNKFKVRVTNKNTSRKVLILNLVANPGLSLPDGETNKFFTLDEGETAEVASSYRFHKLSPFGKLRIRIFEAGRQDNVLYEARFHLGAKNPTNQYDLSKFGHVSGSHLNLYFLPGTLAATQSETILRERELGISKIEKLIGSIFKGKIDLFLYPDMETKRADTLHTGEGWAFDGIMVEVYNADVQLDPFHELTHIITGPLGAPPAMFDEGFAVYAAETLGADALKYVGSPGQKVDDVVNDLKKKDELIALRKLISVTNIGDTPESAAIEYPQSASFVKFLIHRFGVELFRSIFSSLRASNEPEVIQSNIERVEKITGRTFPDLEAEWLESLSKDDR